MAERHSLMLAAERATLPSPLDPFLRAFLDQIEALDRGFSPVSQTGEVAGRLGWPVPFVETLFVSARARGLVALSFERGMRNRWQVTSRGGQWRRAVASMTTVDVLLDVPIQDDTSTRSLDGALAVGGDPPPTATGV